MENEIEKSGLVSFLETKNISEEMALSVAPSFEEFFIKTNDWKQKAIDFLNDPNISDEEKAKQARIARLALVKVRTGIDGKRKEINDNWNKQIKEVNGIAAILTDPVKELEDLLVETEKAQEIAQKAINDKIKADREAKLAPYGVDSTFYDLINMPDDLFEKMLEKEKLAHEAKIQNEKEAEELRLQEEKINSRVFELLQLGFSALTNTNDHFELMVGEVKCEVTLTQLTMGDEWKTWIASLKRDISYEKEKEENAAKLRAEEAEKETARLKAEKEELERAENARKQKHAACVARQQMLALINSNMPFDEVCEMQEEEFNILYKNKKEVFDAEQLKLYKEKKKKEIEEAQAAKLKAEKEAADCAAKLAPDKTKIQNVVDEMKMPTISTLEFKSGETEALYATIQGKFEAFKKWANEQVNTLK